MPPLHAYHQDQRDGVLYRALTLVYCIPHKDQSVVRESQCSLSRPRPQLRDCREKQLKRTPAASMSSVQAVACVVQLDEEALHSWRKETLTIENRREGCIEIVDADTIRVCVEHGERVSVRKKACCDGQGACVPIYAHHKLPTLGWCRCECQHRYRQHWPLQCRQHRPRYRQHRLLRCQQYRCVVR